MADLSLCEPERRILFHSAPRSRLSVLTKRGTADAQLQGRMPEIGRQDPNCVLAVDVAQLRTLRRIGDDLWQTDRVPPEAFLNADPYLVCKEVTAAGGVVVNPKTMQVLLIHRNGLWDLPKGKQDLDETLESCALREVREETGIRQLKSGPLLAATMHGYARTGEYRVKTTYWFALQSGSTSFIPQVNEGITRVAWVPWHEARACLGYSGLRDLLQRVQPVINRRARGDAQQSHP